MLLIDEPVWETFILILIFLLVYLFVSSLCFNYASLCSDVKINKSYVVIVNYLCTILDSEFSLNCKFSVTVNVCTS